MRLRLIRLALVLVTGVTAAWLGRQFLRRQRATSRGELDEFIDKCTARCVFEKLAVELYDVVLARAPASLRPRLQEIRDEEAQHQKLLASVIRGYGGNPEHISRSARVVQLECEGIVKVARVEDFVCAADALLAAELVDCASWELLKMLARQIGDDDAVEQFERALNTERRHLAFIRGEVIEATLRVFDRHAG